MDELKELLKRITGETAEEQKLEQQVTGSLAQKKQQQSVNVIIDNPVDTFIAKEPDLKQVDNIMKEILDLEWVDESLKVNHAPVWFLDTKKTTWLYSVSKMTFYPVPPGVEVTLIDVVDDKIKCLIGNDMFEVSKDMITLVGWN